MAALYQPFEAPPGARTRADVPWPAPSGVALPAPIPGIGRPASEAEVAGWDIAVRGDGHNLPPGRGTAREGEELYLQHCAACHGDFGEGIDRWPALMGGRGSLTTGEPRRTIGSFWQHAPAVFDDIRRAMPCAAPQSLSNDEYYAITAYVLHLNELVGEEEVIDRESLPRVAMPNAGGFVLEARPDALNFGSAGIGSGPHLFHESWRRAAGVSMTHVPCRGTGPALQGLLAGDVHLMIGNYGVFRGAHEGGRLRVLAISSRARHPNLPDIPTVIESGVDWSLTGFNGIVAPARIPADRRQRLEDACRAVMEMPETVAQMLSFGSVAAFLPGAALERFPDGWKPLSPRHPEQIHAMADSSHGRSALDAHMREQRAFWTRLVRKANIQAE